MDWGAWWAAHGETVWASIISVIITVVFGYFFYRKAEQPKRFAWEFRSLAPLIQADPSHRRLGLKVSYAGEEVTKPNVITIRLGNRGRKPIVSADFALGGTFLEFDTARVLSANIIANPWLIGPELNTE